MKVEQTHLVRRLNGVFRIVSRFVPVLRMGSDFISGKLVSELLQHRLHLVQLEVHHATATQCSLKSD